MSSIIVLLLVVIFIVAFFIFKRMTQDDRSKINRYKRSRKKVDHREPTLGSNPLSDDQEYVRKIASSHQRAKETHSNDQDKENPDVILGLKEEVTSEETNVHQEAVTDSGHSQQQTNKSASHIITLHVMAAKDRVYSGYELLQSLLTVGLRYGEKNIFHRYEQKTGHGSVLFSLASAVEPGVFDLTRMGAFSCPGLILFLRVNEVGNPIKAFEVMLDTAGQLVEDLGGEVMDENRIRLTKDKAIEIATQINSSSRHPGI